MDETWVNPRLFLPRLERRREVRATPFVSFLLDGESAFGGDELLLGRRHRR